MSEALDILLRPEIPNVRMNKPEADFKVKRLSELAGEPVVFRLRAIGYEQVQDLRDARNMELATVLAGTVSPNWKDKNLMERYGASAPDALVKAVLLPGEISALAQSIEKLSGYRVKVLSEIKKN